ncbi:MAG: hypothetical protein J2P25_22125 [Nocardiopsaceae bacterium]|nr:hypothetical protein [Nocardiopsaceae bacterium]
MSIMLPSELAWVLNLLGFMWPNVDEDELRAAAAQHRQLAAKVQQAAERGAEGAKAVTSANEGKAVQAFASRWGNVSQPHLGRLSQVYGIMGDVQDGIADVVEGAKAAVLVQLGELAAEIAVAAAGSVETFGISDAAGLAMTAVTRLTVREILEEMGKKVVTMIEQVLIGEAFMALSTSLGNLVSQGVADYVGTGHGVNVGEAAGAGVSGLEKGAEFLGTKQGSAMAAGGAGVQAVKGLLSHGGE